MKKIILTLVISILLIGCNNQSKTKKENGLKIKEMEDLNHKDKFTNSSKDAFYIKLNTIPYEMGLENYSDEAKELTGEVTKQLNGVDGSEYFLLKLDKTLNYKVEDSQLKTNYLIIGGRFKQQPLRREANKTVVNVAIVKDETLVNDHELNFEKAIFAGMGEATEIKK